MNRAWGAWRSRFASGVSFAALAGLLSACVSIGDLQSDDASAALYRVDDATPAFLSVTGGGDYHFLSETLSLRPDGSFEFLSKLNIRYFIRPGSETSTESDAICGVRLSGQWKYFDQEPVEGSFEGHILRLDLVGAEVTSAEMLRPDLVDPLPSRVCRLYVKGLQQQHAVRMVVESFDARSVKGFWASLDIYDRSAQEWIFNVALSGADGATNANRNYLKGTALQ